MTALSAAHGRWPTPTSSMRTARNQSHTNWSAARSPACSPKTGAWSGSVLASHDTLFTLLDVRRIDQVKSGPLLTLWADSDDQLHPAGRHVPQTSGEPSVGIPEWIAEDPNGSIDNTDVVLWHTFGVVHFPSPEDFPGSCRQRKQYGLDAN
jgi:hypothetical protein